MSTTTQTADELAVFIRDTHAEAIRRTNEALDGTPSIHEVAARIKVEDIRTLSDLHFAINALLEEALFASAKALVAADLEILDSQVDHGIHDALIDHKQRVLEGRVYELATAGTAIDGCPRLAGLVRLRVLTAAVANAARTEVSRMITIATVPRPPIALTEALRSRRDDLIHADLTAMSTAAEARLAQAAAGESDADRLELIALHAMVEAAPKIRRVTTAVAAINRAERLARLAAA